MGLEAVEVTDIPEYTGELSMDGDVSQVGMSTLMPGEQIVLDMDDAFERVLGEICKLHRLKANDYARPGDLLANIRKVVETMDLPGYGVQEDILTMVARKFHRITNLRNRNPFNETVRDSYIDLVCYTILGVVHIDGITGKY